MRSPPAAFANRLDGARALARQLVDLAPADPVVLGLPRGGVPVGAEVAAALGADLDVLVARKLGAPGQRELAIGAISEGGAEVLDDLLLARLGVSDAELDALRVKERAELDRRVALYRGGRPMVQVTDRSVVLVDDGLATGATAEAAVISVRRHHPGRVIVAAPVGALDTTLRLALQADEVICVLRPLDFIAVGRWYRRFDQVSDDEVVSILSSRAS